MKNLTKSLLAVLAAALVTTALSTHEAQANQINGTIDFAGAARFDSSHLDAATRVNLWRDINGNLGFSNVAAFTGDFAGFVVLGQKVAMATPWIFTAATPGLWSVGGFTFNLLTATVVTQTATFLNLKGTGIISGNGFEDTPATWAFTSQNAGGNHQFFSFSANAASVPDGGSAAALLGMGLGVIEFIRRRVRLRV